MRKVTGILLILACALKSSAQDYNSPPVYQLTNDTAASYIVESSFTQLLEDQHDQWNIANVSQPPLVNRFHANESMQKGMNYRTHTYWVRATIQNSLQRAVTLHFNNEFGEGNFSFEYIYLYFKGNDERWTEEKTGSLVAWSDRAAPKFLQTLSLPLKPLQQQTVYFRFHDSFRNFRVKNIDLHFQTALPLYQKAYNSLVEGSEFTDNFVRALLLGICITAVLFTFYNYLLLKEKAYLYYLFFLFFYLVARLPQFYFLLVPQHPVFASWWGRPILWIIVHTFLVLFVRNFLNTRSIAPFFDKLLIASAGLQVIYLAAFWLTSPLQSFRLHAILEDGILVTYEIVISTIALTLIQLFRWRHPPARFLLLTLAPFLLLYTLVEFIFLVSRNVVALLLKKEVQAFSAPSKFLVFAEYFTVLWMVVFFSGALTRRYTQARKILAEETLEKERSQKEREIEKSQLIAQQKVELEMQVEQRTIELRHSLESLKATQKQLVQSEKMASLGELTAGIAHEIQNPLNFVNNFSDVNRELLTELKDEADNGNFDEVKAIANDVIENEQKINHHGKRADAIVKGMLQHSRASTGKKEPTDVNALADEYLRLSYHGMRAKDKDFNATIETHFDESLDKIEVVAQDIGRVLLNLFNNAFYAAFLPSPEKIGINARGFNKKPEPTVWVTTKRDGDKVIISVRDNGPGIPANLVDKIFQPFFTTKPTGQGTGLGLSLSYDIIKAHGGEIKVKTKEGDGTEFIVQLPAT